MKHAINAVFENGAFRPLEPKAITIPDGQHVRITIDDENEPEALKLATRVYEGLSDADIAEIERIALDRRNFFGTRSGG